MTPSSRGRPRMRARRGSAYIMVVAIAGLAGVTALAVLFLLGSMRRIVELQNDAGAARAAAVSGVELAAAIIDADEKWRWNQTSGVWIAGATIGGATCTVEVADPIDGDFTDSDGDPVQITARATAGNAVQIITATLQPQRSALEALRWGVFTGGDISTGTLVDVRANTSVRALGSVSADLSDIWPRVVAGGSISGLTYHGGTVQGAAAVAAPDPALIDEYVARGTPISFNSLNSGTLERAVLSPDVNPLGTAAGSAGIYYIDCGNQTVEVRRFRMLGTLVLLNPGPGSRIREQVRFDPAVEGYPSLLVRGDIEIETATSNLSESSEGVNFNPPGAPYAGVTDGDQSDTYPTGFAGLIYTTGNTSVTGALRASAPLLVGGQLTVSGSINSTYTDGDLPLAPPGFGGDLRLVVDPEGVWRGVE